MASWVGVIVVQRDTCEFQRLWQTFVLLTLRQVVNYEPIDPQNRFEHLQEIVGNNQVEEFARLLCAIAGHLPMRRNMKKHGLQSVIGLLKS